jgi:tetratricopeptide (TPR) repeat protein
MDALGTSVDVARERGLKNELILGLAHEASTLTYMTRFDEAAKIAEEGLQVADELGDLFIRVEMLSIPIVFNQIRQGNIDGALATAKEAGNLSRQVGSLIYNAITAGEISALHFARGELEAAYRQAEVALQLWSMMGPYGLFFAPMSRAAMISAATAIGGEFCRNVLAEQAGPLEETDQFAGATAWTDLGFAALQRGDVDRAGEYFEKAVTIPTTFWLIERPRALAGSALVCLGRGDIDGAADQVAEAVRFADERGMRHFDPLLTFVDGQIVFVSGDYPGALERFEAAEGQAARMGMRPLIAQSLEAQVMVLNLLGRAEEARVRADRARTLVDEMQAAIHDQEMLGSFQQARGAAVHG